MAWTQKDDRRATRQIKSLNKRMRKAAQLALGAARRGNAKLMLEHFRDAVAFADQMRGIFGDTPYRQDEGHLVPELAVGADEDIDLLIIALARELEAP